MADIRKMDKSQQDKFVERFLDKNQKIDNDIKKTYKNTLDINDEVADAIYEAEGVIDDKKMVEDKITNRMMEGARKNNLIKKKMEFDLFDIQDMQVKDT